MEEVPEYQDVTSPEWVKNIMENLKNLEVMERYAREGCQTILEYLQIPYEQRQVIIADVQYKNLRLIINELILLITDLTPVVNPDTLNTFDGQLKKLTELIKERKSFVKETYNASSNTVTTSSVTELYFKVLETTTSMRREIIKEIRGMLYPFSEKKGVDNQWHR